MTTRLCGAPARTSHPIGNGRKRRKINEQRCANSPQSKQENCSKLLIYEPTKRARTPTTPVQKKAGRAVIHCRRPAGLARREFSRRPSRCSGGSWTSGRAHAGVTRKENRHGRGVRLSDGVSRATPQLPGRRPRKRGRKHRSQLCSQLITCFSCTTHTWGSCT